MKKKRGKDWHAWAWKHTGENDSVIKKNSLLWFAEPQRPKRKQTEKGKWVKVKFSEIK